MTCTCTCTAEKKTPSTAVCTSKTCRALGRAAESKLLFFRLQPPPPPTTAATWSAAHSRDKIPWSWEFVLRETTFQRASSPGVQLDRQFPSRCLSSLPRADGAACDVPGGARLQYHAKLGDGGKTKVGRPSWGVMARWQCR